MSEIESETGKGVTRNGQQERNTILSVPEKEATDPETVRSNGAARAQEATSDCKIPEPLLNEFNLRRFELNWGPRVGSRGSVVLWWLWDFFFVLAGREDGRADGWWRAESRGNGAETFWSKSYSNGRWRPCCELLD